MQKVDLAELRRLHEAATKGEWRCFRYSVASASLMVGDIVCQPPDDDCEQSLEKWPGNASFIAAAHNALPALLDELEAAEQERDAAKAEVARQWIVLTEIAEEVENYADCDDNEEGIANRPNLAMRVQMMADKATQCNPQAYAWLAARDASMKLEGAAEWLIGEVEIAKAAGRELITYQREYLEQRAAKLRQEAEGEEDAKND